MIIAIIINLILSLYIIPVFIGEKRKIGYLKSALSCVFLTPIVGMIITLLSPKTEYTLLQEAGKSKSNKAIVDNKNKLLVLKNKGLITDDEYTNKVQILENKKDDELLIHTIDYKGIKQLFDSNVLTKEEFDDKISKLKEKQRKFIPAIEYNLLYKGERNSLKHGNYKVWVIKWANGYEHEFYVKNSNEMHFLRETKDTLSFNNQNEFIKYSFKLANAKT